MKALIDADPITRTKSRVHYQPSDEEMILEDKQDVQPVVDVNKEDLKVSDGRFNLDGKTHVARIPLVIWQQWMKETNGDIATDDDLLKEKLNDPDNRAFRSHPGRL